MLPLQNLSSIVPLLAVERILKGNAWILEQRYLWVWFNQGENICIALSDDVSIRQSCGILRMGDRSVAVFVKGPVQLPSSLAHAHQQYT